MIEILLKKEELQICLAMYQAIEDPDSFKVSEETRKAWEQSFKDYKLASESSYKEYRNQTVEKDARAFAGQ